MFWARRSAGAWSVGIDDPLAILGAWSVISLLLLGQNLKNFWDYTGMMTLLRILELTKHDLRPVQHSDP